MKELKGVKYYTDEEKVSIINEYLSSGKSRRFIQLKYGLQGRSLITNWMTKFGLKENRIFVDQKELIMDNPIFTQREMDLEKRVKQLEQELNNEKLRVMLLDKVIEIAERDLNISLKKKFGTKPLKK